MSQKTELIIWISEMTPNFKKGTFGVETKAIEINSDDIILLFKEVQKFYKETTKINTQFARFGITKGGNTIFDGTLKNGKIMQCLKIE